MSPITTPGVYVQTVPPPAALDPVAVDVAAFLGVFERGPLDTPTRVASWPQVQAVFGDFVLNGIGAYALKGWVDNGGRVAHVVRVAAPRRTANAAGAQPPDRGSSVLDSTEGFVVGAGVAIQQAGSTWLYLVAAVDLVSGRVTWDRPLHPDLDLSQPFTASTGAQSATTMLLDDGDTPVLAVSAANPGAWGNDIAVLVDAQYGAATASVPSANATASATAVQTCNGFTAQTLVRILQDAGGGVKTERAVVAAVDPSTAVLEWASPLAVLDPTQPMRIEAETFALSITEDGLLQEVWSGLSLVAGNASYAPEVLQGSALVAVEPATGAAAPPVTGNPAPTSWIALTGGLDGTAALSLDDILGDEAAGISRGLASLASVDEPAILCAPDLVAEAVPARIAPPQPIVVDPCVPCPPAPPPPDLLVAQITEASATFSDAEIATAQQALLADCEARGDRVALLDPPCGPRALDVPTLVTWRTRFESSYGAMYAPWIDVLDPLATVPGQAPPPWGAMRRLPPSGHVAGLIAQVDANAGAWQPPANLMLSWVHQTDMTIDDVGHGRLNAAGVDALRALTGRGVAVLGARTVSSDPSWLFLNVRRLFLLLERTLRVGLSWTVFEPAGPLLERAMVAAITGLLEDLFQQGAFGGETAATSFYVQAGDGDRSNGEVLIEIGIVPAPPAEVILLQVRRTGNQLELLEQPRQAVS
jgi:hypothetical protein